MVHRGEFQLQSFTVERAELIGARRPKELVVSIELPKLVRYLLVGSNQLSIHWQLYKLQFVWNFVVHRTRLRASIWMCRSGSCA
jgi:hypothetical protein